MNFSLACPSCERTLRVPENLLGQAVKCPSCSHNFTAPEGVEEPRPRRPAPPPEDDYEDVPRPSKRRPRREDEDDEYDDAEPRRRGREKPGKVQAISVMVLIGGIIAVLYALVLIVGSLGFMLCWPGTYYSLVLGILAILKGARLLGEKAYRETPPYGIGNMMIINIINADLANLILGILVLVFLSDGEVKAYFRR